MTYTLRIFCLLMVLVSTPAWAEDLYIAMTNAGTADGTSCANAHVYTWFNTAANWGGGAGEIDPGDTVHLCGTFTFEANAQPLSFQTSGTDGNVITLLFEPGAILEAPYFKFGPNVGSGGAIYLNSKSHLLIDGGATCGMVNGVAVAEGSCNGIIRTTANGTNLTYQQSTNGIYTGSTATNVEIRNLVMHAYDRVDSSNNSHAADGIGAWPISFYKTTMNNIRVHHNRIVGASRAILLDLQQKSADNLQVYNNYIEDMGWGIMVAGDGNGSFATDVQIHDNEISDWTNWITPSYAYHSNGIFTFSNCPFVSSPTERLCGIGDTNSNIYNNYIHGTQLNAGNTLGSSSGFIQTSTKSIFNIFNNRLVVPSGGYVAGGFYILGCASWSPSNCGGGISIYNNTMTVEAGGSSGSKCLSAAGITPHTVKNNIFSGCTGWGVIFPQFAIAGACTTLYDNIFISDYNIGYALYTNRWIIDNTTCGPGTWKTLAEWQAEPWLQDIHSTTANPLLDANGRLTTGSSAIGAGVNLTSLGITALNTDANGTARPATGGWDIGAYQLVVTPTPPTAENIYIALTAQGTDTGASCANAHAASWFNTPANWGSTTGLINAGDTVHVCGTWTGGNATQFLTFQGSGEVENPITLVFETGAIMQPSYCAPTGCINYGGNSYLLIDGGTVCGIVTKWSTTACNGQIQNYAVGSVTETCPNGSACAALASTVISVGIGNSTGTATNNTVRNLKLGPFYTRAAADTTSDGMGTACLSVLSGFPQYLHLENSICTGVARGYYVSLTGTLPGNLLGFTITNVSFSSQCRAMDISAGSTAGDITGSITNSEITDWDKWAPSSGCSTFTTALFNGSALQQTVGRILFASTNNYFHGDMTGGVVTSSQWGLLACGTNCILSAFNNRIVSTCTGATPTRTCSPAIKLNGAGPGGHQLYNNTIHGAGAGVTMLITGTLTANPIFKNNIVYDMGSGVSITPNNQSLTSNYNDMNLVTTDWITWDTAGTPVSKTLAQWQASPYLQDLNSATADPLLDASDLLQAGSPAINTGENLTNALNGINVDALAIARPSIGAWDMGAYDSGAVVDILSAPTGLRLVSTNPITLIWDAHADTIAGYRVYQRTDIGAYGAPVKEITFASAASANSPVTRYVGRAADAGITWFAVTAFTSGGVESESMQATVNVASMPTRTARASTPARVATNTRTVTNTRQ